MLKFIVDETVQEGRRLPEWKVIHKKGVCNRAAHELTQLAKRTKHSAVWCFSSPVCVEHIIAQDCNFVAE